MKFKIVVVSKSGTSSSYDLKTRRTPNSLDALIEAAYNANNSDLVKILEEGEDSYNFCSNQISAEDLRYAVDNDSQYELDGYSLDRSDDIDDYIIHCFDGKNDDEVTFYVQELPDAAAEDESDESAEDSDLLTVVLKIHGGEKRTVHVPAGTTFERVVAKSGMTMPAGASYAFNGNDVSLKDAVTSGGQLSAAGKVVGG